MRPTASLLRLVIQLYILQSASNHRAILKASRNARPAISSCPCTFVALRLGWAPPAGKGSLTGRVFKQAGGCAIRFDYSCDLGLQPQAKSMIVFNALGVAFVCIFINSVIKTSRQTSCVAVKLALSIMGWLAFFEFFLCKFFKTFIIMRFCFNHMQSFRCLRQPKHLPVELATEPTIGQFNAELCAGSRIKTIHLATDQFKIVEQTFFPRNTCVKYRLFLTCNFFRIRAPS